MDIPGVYVDSDLNHQTVDLLHYLEQEGAVGLYHPYSGDSDGGSPSLSVQEEEIGGVELQDGSVDMEESVDSDGTYYSSIDMDGPFPGEEWTDEMLGI